MKIYRLSQSSSLMYKGFDSKEIKLPSEFFVTPSASIAQKEGPYVAVFSLKNENCFSENMINSKICKNFKKEFGDHTNCQEGIIKFLYNPTRQWNDFLRNNGYNSFIVGDYLYILDNSNLKFLGFYDFEKRTIKK